MRLDFKIVDGGPFDEDGLTNGSINDPGAIGSMVLHLTGLKPDLPQSDLWF